MTKFESVLPLFDESLLALRKQRAQTTLNQAAYIVDDMSAYILRTLSFTLPQPNNCQSVLIRGPATSLLETLPRLFPHVDIHNVDPLVDLNWSTSYQQYQFDIIIDLMTIHWLNDPLQQLTLIQSLLKPGGFYIAGFLGGSTLTELRSTLIETDLKLFGGAFARVSPMIKPETATRLIQGSGYKNPIVDHEEVTVRYHNLKDLIKDLRNMGESNALRDNASHLDSKTHYTRRLSKSYVAMAEGCYHTLFQTDTIDITFDLIFMSGWSPEPQPA